MLQISRLPILIVCLLVECSICAGYAAAESNRTVLLKWNLTVTDASPLCVEVQHPKGDKPAEGKPLCGPGAYSFVLKPNDRVVIQFIWGGDASGEIQYAITGTDVDRKDLDALKRLVGGAAPAGSERTAASMRGTKEQKGVTKAVSEDLVPAGRLTVLFLLKEQMKGDNQTEVTSYTSGAITFRISSRSPRVTVSAGLALTTAPEPVVTIVNTSNLLTFEKDGKTQQAYERMVSLRDTSEALKPVQSAVSFANFQTWRRIYATLGVQLNQKFFEEPIVGITYRHPLTGTVGANVTAGILFSHELEILESGGFRDGMRLAPDVGLTVNDVPTEKKYHPRFVLAFSVDF